MFIDNRSLQTRNVRSPIIKASSLFAAAAIAARRPQSGLVHQVMMFIASTMRFVRSRRGVSKPIADRAWRESLARRDRDVRTPFRSARRHGARLRRRDGEDIEPIRIATPACQRFRAKLRLAAWR